MVWFQHVCSAACHGSSWGVRGAEPKLDRACAAYRVPLTSLRGRYGRVGSAYGAFSRDCRH